MSYSISDLEQLSGISVHNIRIWERRYNALQPLRTGGNTRFYDDGQLKRLLNIAGLYYSGHKISKACSMNREEMEGFLQKEIDTTISKENHFEYYISQIVNNGMEYKEYEVNQLIQRCSDQYGLLDTYKFVIYPLLVRLGLMWRQDSLCPSQEHFLSSIFRQRLFCAINDCPKAADDAEKWLLFLPESEDHDIGLLLASYLLRTAGKQVVYLGPKVPLFALKNTVNSTAPSNLLFFMTRLRPVDDARSYISELTREFSGKKIYVSGNQRVLAEVDFPAQTYWLKTLNNFEETINPGLKS
ncbi:MAG: MerR family transcriptional regulator [Bacteroidetes bacterium]|jgi:DNA-binding transcriptional MerR regulator|nr:MerR family transcriptional regulator [Bacteroidota bacterium]